MEQCYVTRQMQILHSQEWRNESVMAEATRDAWVLVVLLGVCIYSQGSQNSAIVNSSAQK